MEKSGPLPPTYWFIALALTIGLRFVWSGGQFVPWAWRPIGIPFVVLGAWLTLWTDGLFKKHETTVKPFEDASRLITEGPFRISRHPMYLGMTLILLGTAVLLGSVLSVLPAVAFAVWMQVRFIPAEEASMERIFGEAYREYAQKTRPWV